MNKKELSISVILTVVSGAIASTFIFNGLSIVLQVGVPKWTFMLSIIMVIYGITALAILVWSWLGSSTKAIKLMKKSAILFLVFFVLASFDVGMISGLEFIVIVGVATALWLNWFSVRKVASCLTKTSKRPCG